MCLFAASAFKGRGHLLALCYKLLALVIQSDQGKGSVCCCWYERQCDHLHPHSLTHSQNYEDSASIFEDLLTRDPYRLEVRYHPAVHHPCDHAAHHQLHGAAYS